MIEVEHLSKRYGSTVALDDIELKCPAGATTVLMGSSGSGKSTLLRALIGLVSPDAGSMRFDSEPISAATVERLRPRMGYVIQQGGLFPHLTARDNVTLMARHLGWAADRIDARVTELATLTRLEPELLGRFGAQLSGGQRQRVSLMRALMLDPDVLLLDEPLGALDPIVRADLQDDLRHVFKDLAKTVVLVTHDVTEAAFFADVVVLLHEGRIVQQGRMTDLIDNPQDPFVTRFIEAQRRPLTGATS